VVRLPLATVGTVAQTRPSSSAAGAVRRPSPHCPRQGFEKKKETRQRRAVDALAEGRINAAIEQYRLLSRAQPNRAVYRTARDILEQQLGAE
jgi:hypothetical protein